MKSTRKPRPDARLLNLDPERQEQLAEWLLSGLPYHAVVDLCWKEWNIKTSPSAVANYYATVCSAAILARRRRAVGLADDLMAEVERAPGRLDDAALAAIRQKAFEVAADTTADPSNVKSLFELLLRARKQALDERSVAVQERRVAVLEAKIAQARKALDSSARKGGLSPEALREIERAAKILA